MLLPAGYTADELAPAAAAEELAAASVVESVPTVTVTTFAAVTVTVAGPHSEIPDEAGTAAALEDAADTGIGLTMIVVAARPTEVITAVPVPVGPIAVPLPTGYGPAVLLMIPPVPVPVPLWW